MCITHSNNSVSAKTDEKPKEIKMKMFFMFFFFFNFIHTKNQNYKKNISYWILRIEVSFFSVFLFLSIYYKKQPIVAHRFQYDLFDESFSSFRNSTSICSRFRCGETFGQDFELYRDPPE